MKKLPVPPAMEPFLDGKVLLIDKPLGMTSFGVIRIIRDLIIVSKVGHAGTLDPLATGLLIICTGNFTKTINDYMGMEKEYTGSFTIGSITPTYDLESQPEDMVDFSGVTSAQILEATRLFTGPILQVPPIHSAIKQGGKPVYLAARKGEEVVLEPRPVTIKTFEITGIELPKVYFRVVCSTGTYIRSLANDFGKALGVGAHLSALRRTRIGQFTVSAAQTIEAFEQTVKDIYEAKMQ